MDKMSSEELRTALKQFYGTEHWFRHIFNRRLAHTEGVEFFAKNAGAYWFIDLVAIGANGRRGIVPDVVPRRETFVTILLKSTGKEGSVEAYTDCNREGAYTDERCVFKQKIGYTDCPEGEWKFLLIDDGGNSVLLLPSEY